MIEISDIDNHTFPVRIDGGTATITLSQDEHALPRDFIIMTRSQAWAVWHELGLMLNGEKRRENAR